MQKRSIQNPLKIDTEHYNPESPNRDEGNNPFVRQLMARRFWEIDDCFKCPIVGSCLELTEQMQILKKTGFSIKKITPFEIHQNLLYNSDSENKVSLKIDSRLNQQFKNELTGFFNLPETDFMRCWKNHAHNGNIEGLMWVAATRPDLSNKAKRTIFGDIHMQMHHNAVEARRQSQQTVQQQKRNQKLTEKMQESTKTIKELKKGNQASNKEREYSQQTFTVLEEQNKKLEKELNQLRENKPLESLRLENQALQAEKKKLSGELKETQRRLHFLEDQHRELFSRFTDERKVTNQLRHEVEKVINLLPAFKRNEEMCPSFDLCRKRILLVGGITKLEAYYRKLIEKRGGVFEYHDGYVQGGGSDELVNLVKRADMVICPVDCNSHGACSLVKNLSKKYCKPFKMLPKSSLNAVSQAISECQTTERI